MNYTDLTLAWLKPATEPPTPTSFSSPKHYGSCECHNMIPELIKIAYTQALKFINMMMNVDNIVLKFKGLNNKSD